MHRSWGRSGRGCNVLDRPPEHLFPDSHSSTIVAVPQDCHCREGLPVSGSLFWPVFGSQGLHQSILTSRSGLINGGFLLRYLDNWLVVAESLPLLLHHRNLLQLCRDLGIVVNWEKLDLEQSSKTPSETGSSQWTFRLAGFAIWLSTSFSNQDVAAAAGPHGVTGAVRSPGSFSDAPSPVVSEGLLISSCG